jgi:hypothetical protein
MARQSRVASGPKRAATTVQLANGGYVVLQAREWLLNLERRP